MEDVLDKVQTKEHKGNYGSTKGKSANALYKSYKTWCEDHNKQPMPFPNWIKWAKDNGVVPKNLSADAEDTTESKVDNVVKDVKGGVKKYTSVVIVGLAVLLLYNAWKSDDKK